MKNKYKKFIGICMLAGMFLVSTNKVNAANIEIDGNSTEWTNAIMNVSKESSVAKWSIAQDDNMIYLYIQQNGGNQWYMPAAGAKINVTYDDGTTNNTNMLQFNGNMSEMRDGYYGMVSGASIKYTPSDEANKYEVECSFPKSFFTNSNFTIDYCGVSIKSSDIQQKDSIVAPIEKEPVYEGITVDGTFTDWKAVAKNHYDNSAVTDVAMVFDGDYVYVYLKETSDGALTWSGECANGKFTIYTDTGRNTTFKVNTNSIEGIDGATLKHSNNQYEISIPASAIRQYNETISLGYYMAGSMLVSDVANLQEDTSTDKSFKGISYDGKFGDWNYYPHDLVQYSTPGAVGGDAEAALYTSGSTLFGHVRSALHLNEAEFQPFTVRLNENEATSMNFRLVTVDSNGNFNMNPDLRNLGNGAYEYYLWDLNSGSSAKNINDADAPVYGRLTLDVSASCDEIEYIVDLDKLTKHYNMDIKDSKMIQANYINIGNEWVSIAGTSTNPFLGIILCISVVAGFWYINKRKQKVMQ